MCWSVGFWFLVFSALHRPARSQLLFPRAMGGKAKATAAAMAPKATGGAVAKASAVAAAPVAEGAVAAAPVLDEIQLRDIRGFLVGGAEHKDKAVVFDKAELDPNRRGTVRTKQEAGTPAEAPMQGLPASSSGDAAALLTEEDFDTVFAPIKYGVEEDAESEDDSNFVPDPCVDPDAVEAADTAAKAEVKKEDAGEPRAATQPVVEEDSVLALTNDLAIPLHFDAPKCGRCRCTLQEGRWQFRHKSKPVYRCNTCNVKAVQISQNNMTESVNRIVAGFSEDAVAAFFGEVNQTKDTKELKKVVEEALEEGHKTGKLTTEGGSYQPLSWYRRQGYSAKKIKAGCIDCMAHPVLGKVYKVDILSISRHRDEWKCRRKRVLKRQCSDSVSAVPKKRRLKRRRTDSTAGSPRRPKGRSVKAKASGSAPDAEADARGKEKHGTHKRRKVKAEPSTSEEEASDSNESDAVPKKTRKSPKNAKTSKKVSKPSKKGKSSKTKPKKVASKKKKKKCSTSSSSSNSSPSESDSGTSSGTRRRNEKQAQRQKEREQKKELQDRKKDIRIAFAILAKLSQLNALERIMKDKMWKTVPAWAADQGKAIAKDMTAMHNSLKATTTTDAPLKVTMDEVTGCCKRYIYNITQSYQTLQIQRIVISHVLSNRSSGFDRSEQAVATAPNKRFRPPEQYYKLSNSFFGLKNVYK